MPAASSVESNSAVNPPLTCFSGSAAAFYGDPSNFFGDPIDGAESNPGLIHFSSTDAEDVPEPTSIALAGLALLGAGAATRSRRRRQG